jgi:hypothetical protein
LARYPQVSLRRSAVAFCDLKRESPNSVPINTFQFGSQTITTRTRMLVPKNNVPEQLDVLSAMYQPTIGNVIEEDLLLDAMNSEDAHA